MSQPTLFPTEPPDLCSGDYSKITCPECGYTGGQDTFECVGAYFGNVYCPECQAEFA